MRGFNKKKGTENTAKRAYMHLYEKYSQVGGSALDMTTVMRQPTEADIRKKFGLPEGELKKKKQLMRVQESAIANHFLKEQDMIDKLATTGTFNQLDQNTIFTSAVELWTALGASESAAIEDVKKASTYRIVYLESVFEVWKRYNLALAQSALNKFAKNEAGMYEHALTALVEAHTAGTTIGTLLRGPKLDVSQLSVGQKKSLASAFSPTVF